MFVAPNRVGPGEQAKIERFVLFVTSSAIAITLKIHQVSMAVFAKERINHSVARHVGTIHGATPASPMRPLVRANWLPTTTIR